MHFGSLEDLQRWRDAGLVTDGQVRAILRFEAGRQDAPARLRWPVILAIAAGALLMGAGVLLFVAAHWAGMSPLARFLMVLGQVLLFHLAAAWFCERMPRLATALHGLGTLALGAGIFLAGQIFNMAEHWPAGVLLWALGAGLGCALLRDWVQATLAALLLPFWLSGEWIEATRQGWEARQEPMRILAVGLAALAFSYLSARRGRGGSLDRKALAWIGQLALIPAVASVVAAGWDSRGYGQGVHAGLSPGMAALGWSVALGAPLGLALALRQREAWLNAVAIVWVMVLAHLAGVSWLLYSWCALGAIGLVAWGLHEERRERVNLGMGGFALTVFCFYFSSVMDKLGRSLGLMGLGLLFLLGGWQLERLRRRLNARIPGGDE